jgi:hypothetical protein
MTERSKNLLETLKDNWMVVAFIVQLIVTYALLNSTVANHEQRIVKLEDYREKESIVLADIQSRLASIETSIMFIKERLR